MEVQEDDMEVQEAVRRIYLGSNMGLNKSLYVLG